uniref:UBX domain-containing protein n=1 Tax=Fundulus heteroclitus TaxID=8078 RepID=A0A146UHC9_FUNHE
MGFARELAEEAVGKTGGAGVAAAIEYIDSGRGGGGGEEKKVVRVKCDECGKVFKSNDDASFHAFKSDHSSFSEVEGVEDAAPLTEEQLRDRKFELLDKIAKFREKKRLEMEMEAIAEEKKRREEGRKVGTIRAEMRDVEMKRATEERMRDIVLQKESKARLLKQIKADREAMRERRKGDVTPTTQPQPQPPPPPPTDNTQCHIQVRWPDGRCFTHKFDADEPLATVRDWITNKLLEEDNRSVQVKLSSTIPKKQYTSSDMDQSLKQLGLCPSTCLFARVMNSQSDFSVY